MTGGRPGLRIGQRRPRGEPGFAGAIGGRQLGREGNVGRFARTEHRHAERHVDGRLPVDLEHAGEGEAAGRGRVVAARHPEGRAVEGEENGRVDGGELGQPGGRGVVGQDHAVHHEVAVVDDLSEVAAVGVELGALLGPAEQPVITPFPDEAAVQPAVAGGQRIVLSERTRSVAHGVRVLAHQERFAADPAGLGRPAAVEGTGFTTDRCGLDQVRVHPRVDVGVRAGVITLVVHGAFGVPGVHPLGGGGQVDSGAGLVAERPDHHAGMVLVPFHGAFDPIQVAVLPPRIVARVVLPAAEDETVGLQVALVDHPEAELVGQVEHAGMRRVVAETDRIDSCSLHHDQIGAGVILVEHASAERVSFVAVHPAEDHLATVDAEHVSVDRHRPKSQPQLSFFAGRGDRGLIQAGLFGTPRVDLTHVERGHVGRSSEGLLHPQLGNGDGDREPTGGAQLRLDAARAVLVVGGAQPDVLEAARRTAEQGDLAEDAGQPPLILVLQIAHRRPLVHPHHDHVSAGTEEFADVELLSQPATLSHPDLGPVQPDPVDRFDPVEPQQNPGQIPVGQIEVAPVFAGRILVRHVRRIDRERVADVGVDRRAVGSVSGEHPMGRNLEVIPVAVVEFRLHDGVVGVVVAAQQPEPPGPVEAQGRSVGTEPGAGGRPPA